MEFLYSIFIFIGFFAVSYDIVTASKFFILSSVSLLFPYFGISLTFGFMIHLILVIHKQSAKIKTLEETLDLAEKDLSSLSQSHQQMIEKTITFASRFKTPTPHCFKSSNIENLLD